MSVNVFIYVWFRSAWIFAAFTNKMYISLGFYCWLVVLLLFFPFALFRFFSFISQPKRKTHTLEYKRIAKYVYWIFNGIQIGIDTWNEFRRFTTSIFQFGFVYPVLCHKCRTVKYQKNKIKQRYEKQWTGETNKVDTHGMKSCECSYSIATRE